MSGMGLLAFGLILLASLQVGVQDARMSLGNVSAGVLGC